MAYGTSERPESLPDRRLKEALLAHVRQDFSAPVGAIVGYAEILIEDAPRQNLARFVPDLAKIHEAGLALQRLIDGLLDPGAVIKRGAGEGYEVLMALDGEQGVEAASSQNPDLILMDMSLPVIDGWEATRRIKAAAGTRAIPVIALTAHAMADDRDKALAAGCDDYDTKPVDLPRLLDKINGLLARQAG